MFDLITHVRPVILWPRSPRLHLFLLGLNLAAPSWSFLGATVDCVFRLPPEQALAHTIMDIKSTL